MLSTYSVFHCRINSSRVKLYYDRSLRDVNCGYLGLDKTLNETECAASKHLAVMILITPRHSGAPFILVKISVHHQQTAGVIIM